MEFGLEMLSIEPSQQLAPYVFGIALLITAIAAWTDWRGGHISNYLTLPPVVIGPICYGLAYGINGLFGSLFAVVLCGLGPYLVFRIGGMAGGDVKLFAALAAICGPNLALEAQFFALVVAAIYALGRLTWDGKLFRTLGNVVFIVFNPMLPKRWRRGISNELMERLRLGGAIFAGLVFAVLGRYQMALFV